MKLRSRVVPPVLLMALLGRPSTTEAQLPEEFTNLRFFSEDISQQDLIGNMRQFSMATGLRCTGCHVGEEGQPFSTFDFASDEKLMKRKARRMLEMTRAINDEHLAGLEGRGSDQLAVSCATCHGGVRRPVPIASIVGDAIVHDGLDAATAQYRRLRERYFGTRAYDFGERPLIELAMEIGRGGESESGIGLLRLNTEFFPRSDQSYFAMGELHRLSGQTADALDAYRRALEVNPDNVAAQRRIREMGGS